MAISTILLVILILLLLGALPNWHGYGFGPSGLIGLLVVVLLVLVLLGYV